MKVLIDLQAIADKVKHAAENRSLSAFKEELTLKAVAALLRIPPEDFTQSFALAVSYGSRTVIIMLNKEKEFVTTE